MKALLKTERGKGFVEIKEVEEPSVKAGTVKIKVSYGGICGTDLKIRKDEAPYDPPVILCHEFSGIVSEVGEGVKDIRPGDRVVSETAQVVCGHCFYCKTGEYLMCPERKSIGYGVDGAFAEYIVVRDAIVHKIPDGVSMEEAAMCEPLAVAIHAVYDPVKLNPVDKVVVQGAGAIGQLVAQVVKGFGCTVIATGIDQDVERLELLKKLGIQHTVNTQREDLEEVVNKVTNNMGADYIFDATGSQAAISYGIKCLKRNGTFVQIGLTRPELEIPYAMLPQKQLTIKGVFGHNWLAWERGLQMLKTGMVNVKPLLSEPIPLEEWEKGFEMAQNGDAIKVLLKP